MPGDTEKEIKQLQKRFLELAQKSYHQNIFTFSNFLGLSEQNVFRQMEDDLRFAGFTLWGGQENTDRKMVRFGLPDTLGYEEPFPIACIHMKPLMAKFADAFSHRDFLGALMNLGIERDTVGDIKVGEKEGYLFCLASIAPFICENLNKVKHTSIQCVIVDGAGTLQEEEPESVFIQVSSERIDAVISKVYHLSRSDSIQMFRERKVYVDGRLNENNSRMLKTGEIINVRGFGKFMYDGENKYETKKGKLCVHVKVFR